GKRRVSCLYSVLDRRSDLPRDSFIRMRSPRARFFDHDDFGEFARQVDARFSAIEARDTGFGQALDTAAVRLHRALCRRLPFAYPDKVFNFIPFDVVIGLIPPHVIGGSLTEGLMEPVWCGTTTPGLTSCVIVPNRSCFALGFFLTAAEASGLGRMDETLARFAAAPAPA
ncbi:MAG TPA: hypothetical protein VMW31_00210, partial [Devosiaceae bacterium]|nr:hypothetical protein [Devosiaceae bacterium]